MDSLRHSNADLQLPAKQQALHMQLLHENPLNTDSAKKKPETSDHTSANARGRFSLVEVRNGNNESETKNALSQHVADYESRVHIQKEMAKTLTRINTKLNEISSTNNTKSQNRITNKNLAELIYVEPGSTVPMTSND